MNYPVRLTRKAILIGSPGGNSATDYLRGIKQDLQNFKNFLRSDVSGRWYEDEIIVLEDPSVYYALNILHKVHSDYSLVYFSGHGYTKYPNNNRMVCFKDGSIADTNLFSNSLKQLVIVDACRNYANYGIYGVPPVSEVLNFKGFPIREYFDWFISNSRAGKTIVHATQLGEYAVDSSEGGHFTKSLLQTARSIKADQELTYCTINNLLPYSQTQLQKWGNKQRPCVAYKTGQLQVPFAIGIPNMKLLPATTHQKTNTSNIGGWIAFGVIAALIWSNSNK